MTAKRSDRTSRMVPPVLATFQTMVFGANEGKNAKLNTLATAKNHQNTVQRGTKRPSGNRNGRVKNPLIAIAVATWNPARKTGLRWRSARDCRSSTRSDAARSRKSTICRHVSGALFAPAMLMTMANAIQAAAGQSRISQLWNLDTCGASVLAFAMVVPDVSVPGNPRTGLPGGEAT